MSQYGGDPNNPYQQGVYQQPQEYVYVQPQRTSVLAITAFICSLVFCCPLTTIPGLILGIVGTATIGRNPAVRGKGLAIAAIIIALLATVLQVVVAWGYGSMTLGLIRLVNTDTDAALRAAANGDYNGFRAVLTPAGQAATDAEIQSFIDDLESRFGSYRSLTLNERDPDFMEQRGPDSFLVPVTLDFQDQTVDGVVIVKWIPLTDFKVSGFEVSDGADVIEFP